MQVGTLLIRPMKQFAMEIPTMQKSFWLVLTNNKSIINNCSLYFFAIHDPTTLNRQGNDVGTQYRSVIYYFNDAQRADAEQTINNLKAEGLDIVTELSPVPTFYSAEDYHQNFYARNPSQGYCNFAIPPKLMKLRSKFQALLKDSK